MNSNNVSPLVFQSIELEPGYTEHLCIEKTLSVSEESTLKQTAISAPMVEEASLEWNVNVTEDPLQILSYFLS